MVWEGTKTSPEAACTSQIKLLQTRRYLLRGKTKDRLFGTLQKENRSSARSSLDPVWHQGEAVRLGQIKSK